MEVCVFVGVEIVVVDIVFVYDGYCVVCDE